MSMLVGSKKITGCYLGTTAIKSVIFNGVNILNPAVVYNPLINYDWSTTTAQEYKTDGVELVINGGFDTDSDWNKINGAIISNSLYMKAAYSGVKQNIILKNGTDYLVKFEINELINTNFRVYFNNSASVSTRWITTIGQKEFIITGSTDTTFIQCSVGAGTNINCIIGNISVQKVIQEPNKRYLKDVGSTPTYNASMYFGRGAYLNGVDQTITVPINATIQTALKRVNGIVTINETSQTLTNYVISGLGVHKDYYLFTRLLTTAEKDSYINTPELFYSMAQADNTCVLNMPMCETDGYVRNMKSYSGISVGSDFNNNLLAPFYAHYGDATASVLDGKVIVTTSLTYGNLRINLSNSKKYYIKIVVSEVDSLDWYIDSKQTIGVPIIGVGSYSSIVSGADIVMVINHRGNAGVSTTIKLDSFEVLELSGIHSIINYTSSVRDNAKNLQYGLQTCKFVRDGLGVIQSASDYLECDGVGYAIIQSHTDTVNINMTVNPTSLSGNLLSGGVTKTLTGLTLNIDNDVVISNVTPTGAITLASGFSGTIKSYKEELV